MDGILPYVAPARGLSSGPQATAVDPTHVKTVGDYFRAVGRRIWLVLAIGVPLSVAGAIVAVKQRSIYRAAAEITIDPPQYDKALSTFLAHDVSAGDSEFIRQYVANKAAYLRSKALSELVMSDPAVSQNAVPGEEAVLEIVNNLQVRPVLGSNRFNVTLEGTDPARTKKLLETLLELFQRQARSEIDLKNNDTSVNAVSSLNKLNEELRALDKKIIDALTNSKTIGPGGKSLAEESYLMHGSDLQLKRARMGDFQQQAWMTQMFPHMARNQGNPRAEARLGELELQRDKLVSQLQEIKRRTRNFNSDPSAQHFARKLAQVLDDIKAFQSAAQSGDVSPINPAEAIVVQLQREIEANEEKAQALLKELRESMPEHQKYLNWLDERKEKAEQIRTMQDKLSNFEILSRSQKNPVDIPKLIPEPALPVRPNRVLNIAMGIFFSFGLGIGLVCACERFDRRLRVPEHVPMALMLPLLGVIPRIRRTALIHRGGHLWTPDAPESIEADAYRNLRASLVGTAARHGSIVTLLVTSAKAGEGKSTTALNLAATCARAGERTLLMDVDLRRPSLMGVFRAEDDGEEPNVGLVDVLRGDLPWQRTVHRTEIPNLDFLPTGDTRDIPIEILGTVELRQLLMGLAHHYDRVILDGPATLGLPDCRMLGPFVDAALLVVRSGAHALQPLKRAKAFLEQSNVVLAGVVFNGLYEDLGNWSSYGPNTPYGYPGISVGDSRAAGRAAGLAAPSESTHAALSVVGSAQA
jgi:capsular exopolysaccharide synthesis family protein